MDNLMTKFQPAFKKGSLVRWSLSAKSRFARVFKARWHNYGKIVVGSLQEGKQVKVLPIDPTADAPDTLVRGWTQDEVNTGKVKFLKSLEPYTPSREVQEPLKYGDIVSWRLGWSTPLRTFQVGSEKGNKSRWFNYGVIVGKKRRSKNHKGWEIKVDQIQKSGVPPTLTWGWSDLELNGGKWKNIRKLQRVKEPLVAEE